MNRNDDEPGVAAATRTLALLNHQADGLRAELAQLRADLAQTRRDLGAQHATDLVEANERLLLAALRSESLAETATSSLGELARSGRRDALTDTPNRALMLDRLEGASALARRRGTRSAGEPSGEPLADDGSPRSAPRGDTAPGANDPRLTDLRDANERLVIATLNAQDLEARSSETHRGQLHFLAMVAHELRNPLGPIRVAVEVLDRARTNEPLLMRQQAVIKRQVAHMSRLVDDLLDGSRVSTGKFRLERSRVDLTEILQLAVAACRPAMETRRQRLSIELGPVPLHVHGDAARLVQVFSNLLDNASKYTPEGGRITLCGAAQGRSSVVTVADSGVGITAGVLPTIFDLFVQDTRAMALDGSGLGIGLAVVRELVESHGGTVVATSAGADLGSEFVVTLPGMDPSPAAGLDGGLPGHGPAAPDA